MKIGPYEVLGELGRGGMGIVYRVSGPDGREVALKLLARTDAATLARFEREKRLLDSLGEEDGFVVLLDSGIAPEGPWLVMPLITGGTLREKLERGPLGLEAAVALATTLARALGAAHERGIVHRDVKPENILFTAEGRPLIADLGLAKHWTRLGPGGSQSLSLTGHGTAKGTAGYMAPEQLRDAKEAGPPADVFALGAVLYECLAGRPAFPGATILEVLAKLNAARVTPTGNAPARLEAVVMRALAGDPRKRFANGRALAEALGEWKGKATDRRAPILVACLVVGVASVAITRALATGPTVAGEAPPDSTVERPEPRRDPPAPAPAPSPPSSEAQQLTRSAQEKIGQGDHEGAIADATKAIELDPTIALAWATRGRVRILRDDFDGGIADATKAIELDSKLGEGWLARAMGYLSKEDYPRAISDSASACALDPKLPAAWVVRAQAKRMSHDWTGALDALSRAMELAPLMDAPWLVRAATLDEKGDVDGAIEAYSKAVSLNPGMVKTWLARGALLAQKGDHERAIADYTKALELDPGNTTAFYDRGLSRAAKGDAAAAIADLERFLALAPQDSDAPSARSKLAELKGRK